MRHSESLKDGFYTQNPSLVTTHCVILDQRILKARKYRFSVCIVPPVGGQPFGVFGGYDGQVEWTQAQSSILCIEEVIRSDWVYQAKKVLVAVEVS
jgi:hypothetical protein